MSINSDYDAYDPTSSVNNSLGISDDFNFSEGCLQKVDLLGKQTVSKCTSLHKTGTESLKLLESNIKLNGGWGDFWQELLRFEKFGDDDASRYEKWNREKQGLPAPGQDHY